MTLFRFLSVVPATFAAVLLSQPAAAGTVMIEIADTGAYSLSHAELSAVLPGLGEIDSTRLHLSQGGESRPIRVEDGGDGRFGPGDRISFHAERLQGPESWFDTYATNNVYRLDIDGDTAQAAFTTAGTGPAAGGQAALRRVLHLEEENLQIRLSRRYVDPDSEPDLWFWAKLTQIDAEPFQTRFALPDLGQGQVHFRLGFRGLSRINARRDQPDPPPDHEVQISFNGQPVATANFADRDRHEVQFSLPASALAAAGADNHIELRVPRRVPAGASDPLVDVVMFDYLRLDYPSTGQLDQQPRTITVATPGSATLEAPAGSHSLSLYGDNGQLHHGRRLDDGRWHFGNLASGTYQPVLDQRYQAPVAVRAMADSRWRQVEHGYDYLLIAHASLAEAAQPLAQFHRDNGLRVAQIDVAHLYDEFNHGIVHPRAIRDFIAHAYHHWPAPRPRFVLLVGDASFDIRSERVDDNRYAKWANRELLIPGQFGEIPGQMYQDGDKLAANRNLIPTWQYPSEEGHSAADNYFVAVDGDDWLPDLALGRFPVVEPEEVTAIVDKTLGYATQTDFGDWRRRVLFTTDTSTYFQNSSDQFGEQFQSEGFEFTGVYAETEQTDNLPQINALNDALNDGQLLVHFIGHGGRYIWRTGPPDPVRNHDLFTLDHVAGLDNGDRLPMVLSMTCYSAPFDHPSADSIGERFLREPGRGAIAVFAASWRNSPTIPYSQAVIDELMLPGAHIGEAIMRAKRTLTAPHQRTLVETYNLLGDPAVILKQPTLPVQLDSHANGSRPLVTVDAGQPVNGRALLEWTDEEGRVLASRRMEMRGRQLRLRTPEGAAQAQFLNAHIIDYASRNDGVSRLHLASANGAANAGDDDDPAQAPPAAPVQPRIREPVDPEDQIIYTGMEGDHADPA